MPFAPGDPRINRNGRPKKGETLTAILTEMGNIADVTVQGEKIERKKAVSDQLWRMAIQGDMAAIKYIYDRIDGQPVATQNITADIETSVSHNLEALTTDELKTLAAIIAKT